jgi:hypothetical protein
MDLVLGRGRPFEGLVCEVNLSSQTTACGQRKMTVFRGSATPHFPPPWRGPGEGRSLQNHYLPGFFGAPAYLLQYCTRPRFSRVLDLFRGEPARPDPFSREPGLVSGVGEQYPGKWTSFLGRGRPFEGILRRQNAKTKTASGQRKMRENDGVGGPFSFPWGGPGSRGVAPKTITYQDFSGHPPICYSTAPAPDFPVC